MCVVYRTSSFLTWSQANRADRTRHRRFYEVGFSEILVPWPDLGIKRQRITSFLCLNPNWVEPCFSCHRPLLERLAFAGERIVVSIAAVVFCRVERNFTEGIGQADLENWPAVLMPPGAAVEKATVGADHCIAAANGFHRFGHRAHAQGYVAAESQVLIRWWRRRPSGH
jgi:hypothetical protein